MDQLRKARFFQKSSSAQNHVGNSSVAIYVYLENTVHSSLLSVFYKNQLHRRYNSQRMCLI